MAKNCLYEGCLFYSSEIFRREDVLAGLGDEDDGVDAVVRWMVLPQPHEVLVRLGFGRVPHLEVG